MLANTLAAASSWAAVVVPSALVLLVLGAWGHVFLCAAPTLRIGGDPVARRAEEFIYGVLGFSMAGFIGVLAGFALPVLFGGGTMLVAAAWLLLRRKRALAATAVSVPTSPGRFPWFLAPTLVLIGSIIWSIVNLQGLQPAGSSFVLVPWIDVFFHARQISIFASFDGDPAALNAFMYGVRLPPYHYGSYMVPALVVSLGKAPALQVATSLYPVLGMGLTGAAMLVLAGRHGVGTALFAVVLLFFLPDLSCWSLAVGRLNSYFFLQQVGVGGGYATAIGGMSLASALQARDDGALERTGWAAFLLLSMALFKIQILFAYGAFFAVLIVWLAPIIDYRLKGLATLLIVLAFAVLLWGTKTFPNVPTMSLSLDGVRDVFRSPPFLDRPGAALLAFPLAALAALAAYEGPLLGAAVSLGWLLRGNRAARSTLLLTGLFLLSQACVRLLIANNRGFGDASEINRKTFVLPYFVLCYGVAVLACEWLRSRHPALLSSRPVRRAAVAVGTVAVVATAAAAARLQQWPGTSEKFTRTEVPAGLLAAAQYLRRNAARGDVVQLCRNDVYNELATLAERPVYIAKLMVNAPPPSAEEIRRLAKLDILRQQSEIARAVEMSSGAPIAWWVESPGCGTRWARAQVPVFRNAGYGVYRLNRPLIASSANSP